MHAEKGIKIGILGDGGWGTTLAIILAKKKHCVGLWGAFPEYLEFMDRKRENVKFLPGIKIPRAVKIFKDAKKLVEFSDIVVLAVPSQYLRSVLERLVPCDFSGKTVLSVVKGIENGTYLRVSEVIKDVLGKVKVSVLSGPSISHEVACGLPTAVVIASGDINEAKGLQKIFATENFRIYVHSDMVGVELGGALKNVIAIACGISDGLGFGANSKAAILNRGIVEIMRLGVAMGAQPETFWGLSGMGDLVTTCISPYGRNRWVGEEIGKGKKLKVVLKNMQMVAEGVWTVRAAYSLAKKYKIEMPITEQVYKVLYENRNPRYAVNELMSRRLRNET